MPKSRAPYPAEFRQQIVALAEAGRTPQELAQEFEPSEQTIRTWIKQAQIDVGQRHDGPTTDENRSCTGRHQAADGQVQLVAVAASGKRIFGGCADSG